MLVLLPHIRDWFEGKPEHLKTFANSDCRLEGWFKGELLVLFSRLARQGVIAGFEREVNIPTHTPGGRFQIDFKVTLGTELYLCELKALCISRAAGTPRNLNFYFRDDGLGLVKDFKKLDSVPASNKWMMAFIYPVPDPLTWKQAVGLLPTTVQHWRSIDQPPGVSKPLFVSLWKPETVGV